MQHLALLTPITHTWSHMQYGMQQGAEEGLTDRAHCRFLGSTAIDINSKVLLITLQTP